MAYRSAARCEFCNEMPAATCARCACAVCQVHANAQGSWCVACEKELRDALDIARFSAEKALPGPDSRSFLAFALYALETWWWWTGYEERAIRRRFLRKTREEILAWRRGSGVPVRE